MRAASWQEFGAGIITEAPPAPRPALTRSNSPFAPDSRTNAAPDRLECGVFPFSGTVIKPLSDRLATLLAIAAMLAAMLAFALQVVYQDANRAAFITFNAFLQGLPAGLWASVSVLGSSLGALALFAPTLRVRPRWAAAMLLSMPFVWLYSQGFKWMMDAPRPPQVLDQSVFHFTGTLPSDPAFPSGHATTAFCLAAVVTLLPSRNYRALFAPVALALAVAVALSRIALGVHWPLDVAAGAAGGWICGMLGVAASGHWRFWEGRQGIRLMAATLGALSLLLALQNPGHPSARLFQWLLALWGITGAAMAWPACRAGHHA